MLGGKEHPLFLVFDIVFMYDYFLKKKNNKILQKLQLYYFLDYYIII